MIEMRSVLFLSIILSTIQGSTLTEFGYEKYRHFIVVSSQGNDTKACLNHTLLKAAVSNPCKTLGHALNSTRNATEIILEPGEYDLTVNATFENVFNFRISGNGSRSKVVTIECSSHVGFSFLRSGNIQICGITFKRCGSIHPSTVGSAFRDRGKDHIPFYSGVYFAYTKDVNIHECKITESQGIGLVLYDVGGEVNISKSIFSKNAPEEECLVEHDHACAGGGVYVEFTFEGALPPFNKSNHERCHYQNNNNYLLEECSFEENLAPEQNFFNNIEYPSGTDHMPFGRGGGVSVYVKGTAMNNTFTIRSCNFLYNGAVWGAGLFVEFQDKTENNTMFILQSNFSNNFNSTAGGAVRTGIAIWKGKFYPNQIIHEDCIYENNSARLGGGVSHYSPSYHPIDTDYIHRTIKFKRCDWINNGATVGSALGLVLSADMTLSVDFMKRNPKELLILPYIVQLENCRFIRNRIIKTEDKIVIGQGALYTFKTPLVFIGNVTFENNNNTALVMDNAVLKLYGTVTFNSNSGLQGGGLGVYGESLINLMPASFMYFKRNNATERGGGMFVNVGGPPIVAFKTTELNIRTCFLAYNDTVTVPNVTDWKTNITFEANIASDGGGNSIYATTLQACRSTAQHRNESLNWRFIRYFDQNGEEVNDSRKEIATDPIGIVIDEKEWTPSPGETFSASVKLKSEKGSSVRGLVHISVDAPKESDARLGIGSPLILVKDIGKDSKVSGLMFEGICGRLFDLTLKTVTGQVISVTKSNLSLSQCRLGFTNDESGRCVCLQQSGISGCSKDNKNVFLKKGYWGGKIGNGTFTTYPCPPGYCNITNEKDFKKNDFLFQYDTQCATNRDSSIPLCGECRKHYNIILGSEDCVKTCQANWILPLLIVLLTPVFVWLVLMINIDIFTAYLNAWLYFHQVIEYLLKENTELDHFMTFVIGLANWRIKIKNSHICIFPGLTNFYELGVSYVFPFYVFLLLFVLSRIRKFIGKDVCRALCNLLVFCYTDITITTFKLVYYVKVSGKWLMYLDASIDFEKNWKDHLPFTILAIVLLIFFVALLPILLLLPPWLRRKSSFLRKNQYFFNIFQSCFVYQKKKNKGEKKEEEKEKRKTHRWFAAFYFLCRIWILLMALYVPPGPLKRSILEATCVAILGIFLYVQPYNTSNRWLNTSDAFFLTTLCFVTVFSSARMGEADRTTREVLMYLINVLAYVPLVYLTALAIYCVKSRLLVKEQRGERLLNESEGQEEATSNNTIENEENSQTSPA